MPKVVSRDGAGELFRPVTVRTVTVRVAPGFTIDFDGVVIEEDNVGFLLLNAELAMLGLLSNGTAVSCRTTLRPGIVRIE